MAVAGWSRTSLLPGLALIGVAVIGGCGWHPVYAPSSSAPGGAAAMLGRVEVAIIGERQGQLLRQALQARLPDRSAGGAADYLLDASYAVTQDNVAIMPDSSVTRIRMIATSSFTLRSVQGQLRTCTSGTARSVDGYDMQNEQFFASDLESETASRRLAHAVADQIVLKLAMAARSAGGNSCEGR